MKNEELSQISVELTRTTASMYPLRKFSVAQRIKKSENKNSVTTHD